ncbi:hypothetical protein, partial [Mesorhizobium sp.]|uniref:hypothetical protein n=1 Tax=Mesorhizobium sp. TaxID=1871066 RepID=UPI0025C40214
MKPKRLSPASITATAPSCTTKTPAHRRVNDILGHGLIRTFEPPPPLATGEAEAEGIALRKSLDDGGDFHGAPTGRCGARASWCGSAAPWN